MIATPSRVASLLLEWRSLSVMNLAELATRLGRSPRHVDRNTAYGRMAGLIEYHNPETHPGRFYFDAEQRPCVLAYFSELEEGDRLSPAELEQEFGPPAVVLRSRAGKDYRQAVYPRRGLAFSANQNRVAFIEIFPPTTIEDYLARIHDEPGAFVR